MSDAAVHYLSIARIKRLGRGFEAHVSEQHSLVLTHPWIEVAMGRDKALPLNEHVLWRPVRTYGPAETFPEGAAELEVANPIAFEDLFPEALANGLLDTRTNCMVAYRDQGAKTLKRTAFRSLFRRRQADRHEISLHRLGGIWYMAAYLGLNYEVPLGAVSLVVSMEGCLDGRTVSERLFNIPVVCDKRNERENLRPYPGVRR